MFKQSPKLNKFILSIDFLKNIIKKKKKLLIFHFFELINKISKIKI